MLAEIPQYGVIYYSLLFQIVFGEYVPGDKLPPRSELARVYHTSERTVRRALSILLQNGYISMCSGRSPVVVFDPDSAPMKDVFLQKFEERRGTLRDILTSYRVLMPSFVYLGLSRLSREEMSSLFRDLCASLDVEGEAFDRRSYSLVAGVLMKTGSQNIFLYYVTTQLYMRLHTCAQVRIRGRGEQILSVRRRLFANMARDLRGFLLSEGKIRRGTLMAMADWYVKNVLCGLGLDDEITQAQKPAVIFQNFEPKYFHMSFDIIQKISDGKYRVGDFLPSDTAAAAEYGVAALTARKAYKILNEIGFAKTVPQVGTQVMFNASGPRFAPLEILNRPEGIQSFLDGLRFLRAAIHGIALWACNDLEALTADLARLHKKIQGPSSVFKVFNLISLVDCVVMHTRNTTCYAYFSLMKPSLYFGSSLLRENPDCAGLLDRALNAAGLLREGNRKAFAVELERVVTVLADCAEQTYALESDMSMEPVYPLGWVSIVEEAGGGSR